MLQGEMKHPCPPPKSDADYFNKQGLTSTSYNEKLTECQFFICVYFTILQILEKLFYLNHFKVPSLARRCVLDHILIII